MRDAVSASGGLSRFTACICVALHNLMLSHGRQSFKCHAEEFQC